MATGPAMNVRRFIPLLNQHAIRLVSEQAASDAAVGRRLRPQVFYILSFRSHLVKGASAVLRPRLALRALVFTSLMDELLGSAWQIGP